MNKTYKAITPNFEVEFDATTPRESLDEAMKFAHNAVRMNVSVTILRGGDIVWSFTAKL